MSWGDVRGLLQYVPQFRGKVFVILVNAPEPALAEVMLDLLALQRVGVHLVICLLYTSPSPRDQRGSRMPSSA